MGDFDPAFVQTLARQSWSFYGVGIFLILLRMYARIHQRGIRGLQPDDYLMILAGGLYTMLIVCLNVISSGGGSNLYEPDEFSTFSPEDIQERIKGSKIVIVSEQAMLNVIYTIKACMLIMYTRLTLGLQIQRMVFYLSIYVFIGWIATEIAFFTACRPFRGYWAMPPPNPQCTTLQHYAIVQACFNISSDSLMLTIPLPLLLKLDVPWKQKSVLVVIFSMGIFVILAAILTKVFNLSNIWDPSYMLWYTREASVAVYVSNLPMIWPLMREWFPALRTLTPGPSSSRRKPAYGASGSIQLRSHMGKPAGLSGGKAGNGIVTTIRGTEKGDSTEELSGSDKVEWGVGADGSWSENSIGKTGAEAAWGIEESGPMKGGIHMSTVVQIEEEHFGNNDLATSTPNYLVRDLEAGNSGPHVSKWK